MTSIRATEPATTTARRLVPSLVALLASEVFHIAATVAHDGHPASDHPGLSGLAHVAAVLVTVPVLLWAWSHRPRAGELTALLGGLVAVSAVLYHVLPAETPLTNPFWDGASTLQWLSVVLGIGAGLACLVTGWSAARR